jgi:hypothetical protein
MEIGDAAHPAPKNGMSDNTYSVYLLSLLAPPSRFDRLAVLNGVLPAE